jgi:alkanesulfonate monooxygenase
MQPAFAAVLRQGIELGVRVCIIVRPSREEALEAAQALVTGSDHSRKLAGGHEFFTKTDSVSFKKAYQLGSTEWLTPTLWTGAVRTQGPTAIALVGSPEEVANAIMDYKKIGVSQFIFSGWPKLEEMVYFGKAVLPLVRQKEQELSTEAAVPQAAAG